MTREQFLSYIDDYNAADMERLASHYSSDIVFENFGGYHAGQDVIAFLRQLDAVVESRIVPRVILIEGDVIAMEFDTEVHARIDLPDLPFGAMHEGERKTARTFAFYETDGEIIRHVRIAGWPPRDMP